jgi:hypothetical protein
MLDYFPYGPAKYDILENPEPETFALSQTDFQPQNIFVDDDGNVTGIIDWDLTDTKPQFVGWSRTPCWLGEYLDPWESNHEGRYYWPANRVSSRPELKKYREDYARYLIEACGDEAEELKYTLTSHIFDAVIWALGDTNKMYKLLMNLLDSMGGHIQWHNHLLAIGKDGLHLRLNEWYRTRFELLFECKTLDVKHKSEGQCCMAEAILVEQSRKEKKEAYLTVNKTQRELLVVYQAQIKDLEKRLAEKERAAPPQKSTSTNEKEPPISTFMDSSQESLDIALQFPISEPDTQEPAINVAPNYSLLEAAHNSRLLLVPEKLVGSPIGIQTPGSNSSTRGLPTSSLQVTHVVETKPPPWFERLWSTISPRASNPGADSGPESRHAILGADKTSCFDVIRSLLAPRSQETRVDTALARNGGQRKRRRSGHDF